MRAKTTNTVQKLEATIEILIRSASRTIPAATVRGKSVLKTHKKIIQKIMLSGRASIRLILILLKVAVTNRQ